MKVHEIYDSFYKHYRYYFYPVHVFVLIISTANTIWLTVSIIYHTLSLYIILCLLIAVQERLTKQIAIALTEAVQPNGVAVVIEAT